MLKKIIVNRDYHNSRFDRWFKHNVLNIPQSLLEKFIRKNKIKLKNKKIKTSYRVQYQDIIEIYGIEKIKVKKLKKNQIYKPSVQEKKRYDKFIIENNDDFIVINKPSGIPVQSGTQSFKNIIDILKDTHYFNFTKPYIVHRLDKETSGVMIIAKNREYAQLFTSLFRIRKIHKTYLAIVHGKINQNIKVLKDDLVTYENKKKIIQKAISYLKILNTNDKYSLLELKPVTGRKHQLRKQLFNIGNPIVGDDKYNNDHEKKKYTNKYLMLHAHKIKFMINNNKYNFLANYDINFDNFVKKNFKT